MTSKGTGPAAADTARGDVRPVQPVSEQPDNTAKAIRPNRGRDPFMAARDAWLSQCNSHPDLHASAFKVLYAVADVSSIRDLGYSWLSFRKIAQRTGMSESAIRRALKSATDAGVLHIVSGGDRRKPNQYWPLLDGVPLGDRVHVLPSNLAVVTDATLPSKSPVVKKARDVVTGKFATAKSGEQLPPKSEPDYRRNRQASLLIESPNDESPMLDARRKDDEDDEEIRWLRDRPETRLKAKWVFDRFGIRPHSRSEVRSVARGIARLELVARMDFKRELIPAITAIAQRGGAPRALNCQWVESQVAAEALVIRDQIEDSKWQ